MRRTGCLWVPDFAAQAVIRVEPALRGQPLAILGEAAPARIVIEATAQARARGVTPGMTESQVLARPRRVICRERALEHEAPAQRALLELGLAHSPRVEEAGPGLAYLDLTGLGRLLGDERQIGLRLRHAALALGLEARVGIAGSRISALLAARWQDGVTVIAPGSEPAYLAPAPLSLLDCAPEMARRLGRWGIRTLGELAALPASALFERLGAEGLRLQALARGEDPRPLTPWQPPRVLEEARELEEALETLEPVLALLADLVGRICARLDREQLAADAFEWSCRLADRTCHQGRVTPAYPTREPGTVMALLRAALESAPPRGAVAGVGLRAHPVRVAPAQESLGERSRPTPRALTETMAKLVALVGASRVGVPVLLDSHRPDAVRLDPFHPVLSPRGGQGRDEAGTAPARASQAVLALRRFRPPRPAAVRLTAGRPVHLRSDRLAGTIVASAGPWRTSGEWWLASTFLHDEWDAELEDGTLCRLAHDGRAWFLEGLYD